MPKMMCNPSPLFITIEGGDGAGKSTLVSMLSQLIKSWGRPVLVTREPGGTPLGEIAREWLLSSKIQPPLQPTAELLLFLAARAQHVETVIAPAIASGTVVICDRFNDSTIAYQGYGRGLDVDLVRSLCATACVKTFPSLTLLLDIDPVIGLQRSLRLEKPAAKQGDLDLIESAGLSFHQKVRQGLRECALADPQRCRIIDASQPLANVLDTAKLHLTAHFKIL